MSHEFSRQITVDGANDRAPCGTLNFEAGASAKFHEGEENQISDAASDNMLMHHITPSRLDLPACCYYSVPDTVQYLGSGVSP